MIKPNTYTLADILGDYLSEEAAVNLLRRDSITYDMYLNFNETHQQKMLSFIQGKNGLCITYDTFFKKILNPYEKPERLEGFLSALLQQQVRIKSVLPLEGNQLSEKSSLVIMDMAVELENGSYVNIEIQKVAYKFSGERSTCYLSDFVMRQYNKIKSERKELFSYSDMKPVYLIVIMEHSPKVFKQTADTYLHHAKTQMDSHVPLNFLTETFFISLDMFYAKFPAIQNELDAWLTFFSSDDPEQIVKLVNLYPEFLSCYQDLIAFRKNPKELIYMYSEALSILDRNTAMLMCEEQAKEIEEQTKIIQKNQNEILALDASLKEKDASLKEKDASLKEKDASLKEKDDMIAQLQAEIATLKKNQPQNA